jgi:signal peptidase I
MLNTLARPYYPDVAMAKLPQIARVACVCAFVVAVLTLVSGYLGSIMNVPLALIPLAAGFGILRGRIWSAYGFALYSLAQILLWPLLLTRPGHPAFSAAILISATIWMFFTLLFFRAGHALALLGSPQGSPAAWILVTTLFTLPQLFVRPFVIPTGAMEDTLLTGDRLLVRSIPRAPQRDELVTFIYPIDRKSVYVKRIVGIPGDRIHIAKKIVYRNGGALNEPYASHKSAYDDPYRDNLPGPPPPASVPRRGLDMLQLHVQNGDIIVPIGEYFVIGDNRDQSLDSRYWGFVEASDIIGKPILIYDSQDPKGRHRWNRLFRGL